MIVTTTSGIQGKEIIEYIDIVNGEAIMGANIVRDLFASVRDVVGGRAGSYESKLKEARDIAMDEMKELAKQKGAPFRRFSFSDICITIIFLYVVKTSF
ncbi:heavy metal-binding domain-containing protein [Bacillus sp. BD59S]|uniref:heavy metal-binding domain-containing protein n=1 Tax=Bacillus sp. BD59S TaxID=2499213 RepID=UPI001CBA6A29|nr:heavy metal-binding domain-containing protein [Bacillus sp. BD59S]